jgi:NADPH:quinone reductase-like Zn-dependent oxidoreductase
MIEVQVHRFGSPNVLEVVEVPLPEPGPGQVRIRLTSIGLNHADLMARAGEYRLYSGEPPFVPGLEGGGVIDAVGPGVVSRRVGERVVISPGAPRLSKQQKTPTPGGTYRSHYVVAEADALPAPDALPDDQLGAIWLAYLTAWGCLVWKQNLQPGQTVVLPAASSSVALAAAQIVRERGAVPIGLTTSPAKVEILRAMPSCVYEEILVTRKSDGTDHEWVNVLRRKTRGRGVDVFFDPVAAGDFLQNEIRCLAQSGTIWVYGLLGKPGVVDVTPLIRKWASIRGWVLGELTSADPALVDRACRELLEGFARGAYRQQLGGTYPLREVRRAHEEMELGRHIGKLVLVPS